MYWSSFGMRISTWTGSSPPPSCLLSFVVPGTTLPFTKKMPRCSAAIGTMPAAAGSTRSWSKPPESALPEIEVENECSKPSSPPPLVILISKFIDLLAFPSLPPFPVGDTFLRELVPFFSDGPPPSPFDDEARDSASSDSALGDFLPFFLSFDAGDFFLPAAPPPPRSDGDPLSASTLTVACSSNAICKSRASISSMAAAVRGVTTSVLVPAVACSAALSSSNASRAASAASSASLPASTIASTAGAPPTRVAEGASSAIGSAGSGSAASAQVAVASAADDAGSALLSPAADDAGGCGGTSSASLSVCMASIPVGSAAGAAAAAVGAAFAGIERGVKIGGTSASAAGVAAAGAAAVTTAAASAGAAAGAAAAGAAAAAGVGWLPAAGSAERGVNTGAFSAMLGGTCGGAADRLASCRRLLAGRRLLKRGAPFGSNEIGGAAAAALAASVRAVKMGGAPGSAGGAETARAGTVGPTFAAGCERWLNCGAPLPPATAAPTFSALTDGAFREENTGGAVAAAAAVAKGGGDGGLPVGTGALRGSGEPRGEARTTARSSARCKRLLARPPANDGTSFAGLLPPLTAAGSVGVGSATADSALDTSTAGDGAAATGGAGTASALGSALMRSPSAGVGVAKGSGAKSWGVRPGTRLRLGFRTSKDILLLGRVRCVWAR